MRTFVRSFVLPVLKSGGPCSPHMTRATTPAPLFRAIRAALPVPLPAARGAAAAFAAFTHAHGLRWYVITKGVFFCCFLVYPTRVGLNG
eukprot:scaffold6480_cov82-Isochrysis_galbana.AAC.3